MSEITSNKMVSRGLTREVISEMLMKNYERLPDSDKNFFKYGPLYLSGNASLTGLIANSLCRRALKVTQGAFTSSLPMCVLPFLSTVSLYYAAVSNPLLSGDLDCGTCAQIRGALVGLISAGLYPIILAIPVNLGLAARYSTITMPAKDAQLRFAMALSRPIMRKMMAVLLLHTVFGTYLGTKNFKTYTKLAEITFRPNEEELGE
ncbi:transmembrane protein 126A [Cynoglossus semilaevis]|uniref:transmembrane protein 126A n=1 Tax=Cynoglossus semilaevis TaxID=244447 RepID=UPI0004986428|nr:transmembrane protein 126A [Cynoglossus semilaevis]